MELEIKTLEGETVDDIVYQLERIIDLLNDDYTSGYDPSWSLTQLTGITEND